MDDIALVIGELVKETLNYNEVFAKSEIRMFRERGEILFYNSVTISFIHILMASPKFEHACTFSMSFCCISLPNIDIYSLHMTVLVGQGNGKTPSHIPVNPKLLGHNFHLRHLLK